MKVENRPTRSFLVLGVVLFLMFLSLVIFSRKRDFKSGWNIYSNEEYEFSFSYPPSWILSEEAGQNYDPSVVSLLSPETKSLIDQKLTFLADDISVYYYPTVMEETENKMNNLGATTLDELIDKSSTTEKVGQTTVDGLDAIEVIVGGNYASYALYVLNNDQLYIFSFSGTGSREQVTPTESMILSTVSFKKNS